VLLRGGRCPLASVYPAELRATRALLRRRCHLVRPRTALWAPMQTTNRPYHRPEIGQKLAYQATREGVEEPVPAPSVRQPLAGAGSLRAQYEP
jgi:hypothetical protein